MTDLLGGFKPMDERSICVPLYHEFNELFSSTFSKVKTAKLSPTVLFVSME